VADKEDYWSFKKGYIRDNVYMAARESDKCKDLCEQDKNCAATYFIQDTAIGSQGGFCVIVDNSDTLTTNLETRCGIDVAHIKAQEICLNSLGSTRWRAKKNDQP